MKLKTIPEVPEAACFFPEITELDSELAAREASLRSQAERELKQVSAEFPIVGHIARHAGADAINRALTNFARNL